MKDNFINSFKEILNIEDREISVSDQFRDFPEWDSLANLSVMAMIDEEYGVVFESSEFRKIQTIEELVQEIEKRAQI